MSASERSFSRSRVDRMAGGTPHDEAAEPRPHHHVLVVDDDRRFGELVDAILRTLGNFDVSRATSVASALDTLRERTVDLVLTDLHLPDSDGAATVGRLHGAAGETPIVVLTATDDERTAVESVDRGADRYLVKGSIDVERLPRYLLDTLAQRRRIALEEAQRYSNLVIDLRTRGDLENIGSHVLEAAQRASLRAAVMVVRHDVWLDERESAALTLQIADVVRRTFRRADLVARVRENELAVLLVGRTLDVERVRERLGAAIAATPSVAVEGDAVWVGSALFDAGRPATMSGLLNAAREQVQPLLQPETT